MTLKGLFPVAGLLVLAACPALAQDPGQRPMLEDSIQARYRLTVLGGGLLGMHGGDNAIRRVGGIMVLEQDGFYGSYSRNTLTGNAIRDGQLSVLTGAKDVALARGEKLYVTSVYVGSDLVSLGLLSTRMIPGPHKPAQVWASANFFFSPDTLAQGDLQKVYAVIDQWILPEGANPGVSNSAAPPSAPVPSPVPTPTSVPAASPAATSAAKASAPPASGAVELKAGMTHDQIVSTLGPPLQDVSFGERRWLTYAGLTVSLEQDKVASVDRNAEALIPVRISSDPTGADVFLDGNFVSSTPAVLRLGAGMYKVGVKMSGYADWEREVKILPGAEVSLDAKLSK